MIEPTYSVALYQNQFGVVPYMARGYTWPQIVGIVGAHRPFLDKDRDVPMFGPHDVRAGAAIALESVLSVSFGVLDLDKLRTGPGKGEHRPWTEDEVAEVIAAMDGKIPYVFASSWSHKGGGTMRGRLLFPFSRPVLPSEYPRLWPLLSERFAKGQADAACKDSSHRYYVPSYAEGGAGAPVYVRNDAGLPVDVDALLVEAGPVAGGMSGSTTPTRNDLKRLAERLVSSKKEGRQKLGKALRAVVRGDSYAEAGERDSTLFKLCSEIVSVWPLLDVSQAADHFAASAMIMGPDAPGAEKAADMLTRRQRAYGARKGEMINAALGGDRREPYSQEELLDFADRFEISPDKLRNRWVIQKGSSFYLLVAGTYVQYTQQDVLAAAQRDLSPAISAHVDVNVTTEKGVRSKTSLELVNEYGSVATAIEVDMTAQHPYYDEARRVFVEAPCPVRIKPREHPEIAEWYRLLTGPKMIDRFLAWNACVTFLNEPCAALYLEGAPGTGKSLLAAGLARIWAERPTSIEEALGNYNEGLMHCPFVFGDEAVPTDSRGRIRTDIIREFVQSRTRELKRKYQPHATLRGCVRLYLAANNRNMLTTTEEMNEHDIRAVVERFLYVPVYLPPGCDPQNPPAREYLDKVIGPERVKLWVSENMIAEHALWLRDTLEVPRTGRFLVQGDPSTLTRSLTTTSGLSSVICEWLIGYLLSPKAFNQKTHVKHCIRVNKGRLLVNTGALAEFWGDYVHNDKNPPRPMAIAKAMSKLSHARRVSLTVPGGGPKRLAYRCIDMDNLVLWANEAGYADEQTLVAAMAALDDGEDLDERIFDVIG